MDNPNTRPGRPVQSRNMDGMMAQPSPASQKPAKKGKRGVNKGLLSAVLGVLAVIVIIAAVWFLAARQSTAAVIDGNKYQAVFFTNGQVYFGKLSPLNGDYMRLTDIYYLQAKSEDAEEGNLQKASSQDAPNVQLVKLGSEIHGPDDEMVVNKDQMLFFENLKQDSNVSTTIKSYQAQQTKN